MTTNQAERIPEWTRGDRFKKARSLTGLSSRAFAERIGVSAKTVNNAESDAHQVRKIVTNAWSLATGVPVEWLETGVTSGGESGGAGQQPSDNRSNHPNGCVFPVPLAA